MKKSIFKDWSVCYWVDYSKHEDIETVEEISMEQFYNETKKEEVVVEQPIVEPTEEQLEEIKIQELEKQILRKQALEFLGKDTLEVEQEMSKKLTKKI